MSAVLDDLNRSIGCNPRDYPKIGLLAGDGNFPFRVAEAARAQGHEVVCVGIRDHARPELAKAVDKFYWSGIASLGRMIHSLKREDVRFAVMAGKIHKVEIFRPWRYFHYLPDMRMIRFWLSRRRGDNKDDSLLRGIIEEFEKEGILFGSALQLCPDLLVKDGKLTKRAPSARECRDIVFGWRLAKEMGRLDVGQSVAVKEEAVLAVEAIEGTDQAILRAGTLCKSGCFTVVKVAKPNQDMRFDVPTVGQQTIRNMHTAGARVLAIEGDKTILIDSDDTIALANKHGIAIVAVKEEDIQKLMETPPTDSDTAAA